MRNRKEYHRLWNIKNKERIQKRLQSNKEHRNEINRKCSNARYNADPNFRLRILIRNRLFKLIRRNQKNSIAIKDLGCSVESFKKYIETKFSAGMGWHNYGDWTLDHIIPLSAFDLTDREQMLSACHYTNIQPLWAKDNFFKRNSIEIRTRFVWNMS